MARLGRVYRLGQGPLTRALRKCKTTALKVGLIIAGAACQRRRDDRVLHLSAAFGTKRRFNDVRSYVGSWG